MQENESELEKLRQMQSKLDKELATGGASGSEAEAVNREEADARSIYIGSVDYSTTPEELQQLFQSCGTVNRITILTDKFENPKGYDCVSHVQFKLYEFGFPRLFLAGATLTANTGPILSSPLRVLISKHCDLRSRFAYLEFLEVDAVQTAVALNGTELHGRALKISAKRTNVPGMKQGGRGRGRGGRGRGGFGMMPYGMMPMMMPMMPYGGRGFGRCVLILFMCQTFRSASFGLGA
eukprot:1181940-Prorocentrum_minimum.AAC.5